MNWQETPCYIIQRDNLDRGFRQLVSWLQRAGMTSITVIDNASSYPPLVEFYKSMEGVILLRQSENLGHEAFWKLGFHHHQTGRFIVTDPDVVPDENCPLDLVYRMHQVMDKYDAKVGPALRIDNMHPNYFKHDFQLHWEDQFWQHPTPDGEGHWALIDTTFALYGPGWGNWPERSIRLGPPYVANHIPWMEDSTIPNEEREYYKAHCLPGENHC